MSKSITSASATALPAPSHDLSAALAKLAEAREKDCQLSALKDAQRRAWAAFMEVCDFTDYVSEDDPNYTLLAEESEKRSDAEEAAMIAVMAYPAKTLDEAKSKAIFILEQTRGCIIEEEQVHALLRSFLAVGADEGGEQ
jgi:hypothetical protein